MTSSAAMDLPFNCFWKEVYEEIPNAKGLRKASYHVPEMKT